MSEKKTTSKKITKTNLDEFKKLVRKAVFLVESEEPVFNAIPDTIWENIFQKNFDGNFEFAKRILLKHFKEIEKIDNKYTEKEKNKIFNLNKAVDLIQDSITKKIPIVYITDFDNDGSLAQSIINEFMEIDKDAAETMRVEYAQTVNGNASRGFTVDHVDLITSTSSIDEQDEFLIVTADNGINSRDEQKKILSKYPKAKIIITDHHNPDPEMVTEDNDRTIIFNPHYKPTPFFQKFNISGANTIGVLLLNVLEKRLTDLELMSYSKNLEKITNLCKVSNLLDYVDTHPADKPEKDYLASKFLQLQPLMNINNSISKIITGEINTNAIAALDKKIPQLNSNLLFEEAKNIHIQNHVAKVLLYIYKTYKNLPDEYIFESVFLKEINNPTHYVDHSNINPNYIEQLRPLIFGLNADYEKNNFLDSLTNKMEDVYLNIKISEKTMAEELRRGEVITKQKLPYSVFAYADPHILTVFNRKFLNKVYNDENPGFSVTLDNIEKSKVSGSFRSLYNISDILKNKKKLEKQLNIKIETPGHEKAAGFIIKTNDPINNPIDDELISKLNTFINNSIANIKSKELKQNQNHLLIDFNSMPIIDKINICVRGNISNFERINSLLKLSPDTVWTDAYTTEQFSMEDICKTKKYGYITVNTDFHGGTVIVPVELIRKIVQSNYEDYLSLGYMDGGVFMVDKILSKSEVVSPIDLRFENKKTKSLREAFELDFKDKNVVQLTRNQIQDNPFFKYNDYGKLNFDLFERMVIGIIDTNNVDTLTVFDVEANGFGNAKLINIGSMNYSINSKSGQKMDKDYFFERFYYTQRGEEYLLTSDEISGLRQIPKDEKDQLSPELQKQLLIKHSDVNGDTDGYIYFLHEKSEQEFNTKKKVKSLPFTSIKNYIINSDDTVTYNREIEASLSAYLVKEKDFKVPQEMTNLTGITQELLNIYGKSTQAVDYEMFEFYKNKKVLFGAHNIPYDAKILRANMPLMYETLKTNQIYDSAIFSREEKLSYDDITVTYFRGLKNKGLPNNIFFYDNKYSDFNLTEFINKDKNGYYPDRSNRYLLEIDNSEYYLVDKQEHEKIKINATKEEILLSMDTGAIPANSVKFSVEKLSEQWMIHSLLLCNENFAIKHVDLNKPEYSSLRSFEDSLIFFQDNYHFDVSPAKNKSGFNSHFPLYENYVKNPKLSSETTFEELEKSFNSFTDEFLEINNKIQQKFADAWMYKAVLSIKDPNRSEITNDLIDLVYFQTQIPKDKIRTIFADAIEFKEKYKIDHVLQHEMHANGPWRTDSKGDIAFEDKLTLTLLAQREYNSYEHSVKDAIRQFNYSKIKARIAFDIADKLSDDTAQDSYSFRQGILYDRNTQTSMINKINSKEQSLSDDTKIQVIKYKLDNDVLPQDGFVFGILKEGSTLTRDDIEDHKKKMSFIVLNEQLRQSLHNIMSTEDRKNLKSIIDSNNDKIFDIKKELANDYFYIEYNRKDYQMKQFISKAKDIIESSKSFNPEEKPSVPSLENVDVEGLKTINHILYNYFENFDTLGKETDTAKEVISYYMLEVNKLIENHTATPLEYAITFPNQNIKQTNNEQGEPNIIEDNFLRGLSVLRQKPLERIVNKHTEYRLINSLIEDTQKAYMSKPKKNRP